MSGVELEDFDGLDVDLTEVPFPSVVPPPRLPDKPVKISKGATSPGVLAAIRERLRNEVDLITGGRDVDLPRDDIVEVGSELAGNALGRNAVPPRHLTGVELAYTPLDEKDQNPEDPRVVGRVALLVSDTDHQFRVDSGRGEFHRGLLVAAALSETIGYFPTADGKTVVASWTARRRELAGAK